MDCRRLSCLCLVALSPLGGVIMAFFSGLAVAAEPVTWVNDYPAAVAQARAESKLLLVVDLADDFAAADSESELARLYRSLTSADERVAQLLASDFVGCLRHVGESQALQSRSPLDRARPGKRVPGPAGVERPPLAEYAIAYVCLPSERVLHCIPGFVTADELLRELEWAKTTNASRLSAPPTQRDWFVRERHLAAANAASLKDFHERYSSKWRETFQTPATQSAADLTAAIQAAQAMREQALLVRLRANWPADADRQTLLAALAAHGGLEATVAHPILAEFPLVPLADLARPLFEITGGVRYWQATGERQPLRAWWRETRRGGLTLLVVRDDPFYTRGVRDVESLLWPPSDAAVEANRRHVTEREVTLDELAQLVADERLEPLRFYAESGPPRFLIHDARGFRVAELSQRAGTSKQLAITLQSVANPGEATVAEDARGGTRDERK